VRGRTSAQELADQLEVSLRTVYRDIDSLSAAGVPVVSERGPAGGYRLLDGYRTRLTGMTHEEAESLFLAGLPGPAADLGLGTVLAAAELKLLAALPADLGPHAARIRERFYLDAPGWFSDEDRPAFLEQAAGAVWNETRIRIRYQRWKGEVCRTVDPLGIVLKAGTWYLVAAVDGQERTYRVSRIHELEVLNDRFERPNLFDLPDFWRRWSERFERSMYRTEAQVRFSPRGVRLLPMLLGQWLTDAALSR